MEHFYKNIQGWFNYIDLYKQLIEELPNNFKFAEVGVWKGRSLSYFVVEAINSNKKFEVYAVDTFAGSVEHQKGRKNYEPLLDIENGLYNEFLKNITPIENYVKIIKKTSLEAAKEFPDLYFDTIFLDAGHSYEDVKADLNAWYPKVKEFVMYGHDLPWPGVKKALLEFKEENSLELESVSSTSWKLYKKYE